MSNPFSFTKAKKQAIIALLLKMAESDKTIDAKEQLFIRNIAHQMDLPQEEIQTIKAAPEKFPFDVPDSEQERMTILYYLLFLMKADGVITEKEENYCYKVGLLLGFNHNLIMDLINVLKNYLQEEVPPELMIQQVRKYLN